MHRPAFLVTLGIAAALAVSAGADKMGMPLRSRTLVENVSVYESGQRAIIAWNGREETLILSTDIRADQPVQMLEVLPLPSKPHVTEGSFDAFQRVAGIIESRRPRVTYGMPMGRKKSAAKSAAGGMAPEPHVEIVLHERLGPHEVSVVVPDSAPGFGRWVKDFAAKRDLLVDDRLLPRWDALVRDYLGRGYRYFALDVVSLTPETRSLTPLRYRFATSRLYYALRVSSLFEGHTVANLFMITTRKPDVWGTGTGLYAGFFGPHQYGSIPVKLRLSPGEARSIDPELARSVPRGTSWLTAAHYAGNNSGLLRDLVLYGSR